jgi:hypothetical protein
MGSTVSVMDAPQSVNATNVDDTATGSRRRYRR